VAKKSAMVSQGVASHEKSVEAAKGCGGLSRNSAHRRLAGGD